MDQFEFVDVEFDPFKEAANIAKHGIDFKTAAVVFGGRLHFWEDSRKDYGEKRYIVLGTALGRLLCIVVTIRGSVLRIISARRASRDERALYGANDFGRDLEAEG